MPYFADVDREELKRHQRAFITIALGGPDAYSGRSIDDAHSGHGITDAAFDRTLQHLADALAELKVPGEAIREVASALTRLRSEVVEG
jgi:hemoglobin